MHKKAMTLLELLMVVIIVGVLATLGLINYGPLKEKRMQKLAAVALKYIQAAEELYQVEYRHYYPGPTGSITSDTTANLDSINEFLRLSLDKPDQGWTYKINVPTVTTYTLTATRNDTSGCVATQNKGDDQPAYNSSCK